MDLTSGRWPRWVARYEKGGWAVHFRSDIRKVKRGPFAQVHYEKFFGGGGGEGGGGGGGQFASSPEASQAGTRTT